MPILKVGLNVVLLVPSLVLIYWHLFIASIIQSTIRFLVQMPNVSQNFTKFIHNLLCKVLLIVRMSAGKDTACFEEVTD